MSLAPYEPRGIAAAAIAHLKTLPTGQWLASVPLADAVDTDCTTLSSSLAPAVRRGLVARSKIDGLLRWSIGDGKPLPVEEDEELDEKSARSRPASKALKVPQFVPKAAKAKKPKASKDTALRIALWSDGTLNVHRGREQIAFSRAETEQIVRYLDRLCVEELRNGEAA